MFHVQKAMRDLNIFGHLTPQSILIQSGKPSLLTGAGLPLRARRGGGPGSVKKRRRTMSQLSDTSAPPSFASETGLNLTSHHLSFDDEDEEGGEEALQPRSGSMPIPRVSRKERKLQEKTMTESY